MSLLDIDPYKEKYMKSLFTLLLISLFSLSAFGELNLEDMEKLRGEYSNKRGDALSITLSLEEENEEQPSLFGPEVVIFDVTLTLANALGDGIDMFELTEHHFYSSENGVYTFQDSEDDCDNPGCANYNLVLEVIPKKEGGFWAKASIYFSEDMAQTAAEVLGDEAYENLDDEEFGNFCADYHGLDKAYGYIDSGTCDYEVEVFLSQD